MTYKKLGEKYLLRFDRGDDYTKEFSRFCDNERIALGSFSGLGSFNNCELGFYDQVTKTYSKRILDETHEVVALTGNLSLLQNKPYFHTHVTLTDQDFAAIGGHLVTATVGATLEIVFEKIIGNADRKFNDEIGLNLLDI